MRLSEAWRLSRFPYKEVVYRSVAEERGRMWWGVFASGSLSGNAQSNYELTKRALRIARFDKSLVAIFSVLAAVIPFAAQLFGSPTVGLTSAVSLSLAVTFGFTALYAIQTLSSFVSAKSMELLSTLPLERADISLITVLSFVRSVDYIVVGSMVCQVAAVAFLTGSAFATLAMAVASVVNSVLAVAVALWFSKTFTSSLSRGGRTRTGAVVRFVFVLLWGTLLLGASLLISLPWYIVPTLETLILSSNQLYILLLPLLHPFSAGITIVNLVQSSASASMTLVAPLSLIAYAIVAVFAGRWMLNTVKRISQGANATTRRDATKDYSVKSRGQLFGYVIKDLRVSSRNPATAFFFALPVFEAVIVASSIANFPVLRASTLLVSTFMGGIFVLLMPLALLNAEGAGLEFTKTLPLPPNRITESKTLIATLSYLPVPLVFLVMALLKPATSHLVIIIPFLVVPAIAAASIFEVHLFLSSVMKGRIAALLHDLKKLVVGATTLILPFGVYALVYLVSFSHVFAVLGMCAVSVLELVVAARMCLR